MSDYVCRSTEEGLILVLKQKLSLVGKEIHSTVVLELRVSCHLPEMQSNSGMVIKIEYSLSMHTESPMEIKFKYKHLMLLFH